MTRKWLPTHFIAGVPVQHQLRPFVGTTAVTGVDLKTYVGRSFRGNPQKSSFSIACVSVTRGATFAGGTGLPLKLYSKLLAH